VTLPAVALLVREAEEVAREPKPLWAMMVVAESVAILRVSVVMFLAEMSLAEIMLAISEPETEASEAVILPLTARLPLIRTSPFSAITKVSPMM